VIAFVSPHAPAVLSALNREGIPAVTEPEAAAAALNALLGPMPARAPAAARHDVKVPPLPAGPLNEAEAKALFAHFGVPSVREVVVSDPAEARGAAAGLGEPVVLKGLARHLPHKTEAGAVRLGLSPGEVAAEAAAILARVEASTGRPAEGLLVQEYLRGGVEMILGLVRDPALGAGILLGFGGTMTEIFSDTALRLLPLDHAAADGMVDELRGRRLLQGLRGAPPADRAALVDAVLAFAAMCEALGPRLLEAEINPLFVLPSGQGVRAADGLVVLDT
jgi:acyl-CoA synthetase (NDP forming)